MSCQKSGVLLIALLCACSTVSQQDVHKASMHRRIGQAQLQRNVLALALREYRAAVAANPGDVEAWFGLAETYRRKGMFDDAEASLLEVLDLDPDHMDARLNLTVVFLMAERWDDAIRESTALVNEPTFLRPSRALVNRGWAHYKSGDLVLAERDLREALITDPGSYQARLNLGVVFFDRGRVLDAMVQFERVLVILKRRPPAMFGATEAQARFHLAQANVKLGKRRQAIEHLRRAAERGGEGEWGKKSREYLSALE